jgi:hypothetical protein
MEPTKREQRTSEVSAGFLVGAHLRYNTKVNLLFPQAGFRLDGDEDVA